MARLGAVFGCSGHGCYAQTVQKFAANAFLPLVIALIVLGAAQSILRVLFYETSVVTLLDDAALALAAIAMIFGRFKQVPIAAWTGLAVWAILLLIAVLRSQVPLASTAEAARQIAIPAVLIVIGIALTKKEWLLIAKTALVVGVANGVYAVIEIVFGRLIDPGAMARENDRKPHGVPASYFWYDGAGHEHPRAGGLVLNAPVAGILIAGALIIGWFLARKWWQYALVALLAVPLYLTYSRSGMVIAIAGVLIPLALRYAGLALTVILGAAGATAGFAYFSTHGASIRHVNGLVNAFFTLDDHPFGQGFGTYGNVISRAVGDVDGGESLVGLAIAALGVPGILAMLGLVSIVTWRLIAGAHSPELLAMGLGLIVAGLFVESVSALNGTAPLWVGAGYALMHPDAAHKVRALPVWPRPTRRPDDKLSRP